MKKKISKISFQVIIISTIIYFGFLKDINFEAVKNEKLPSFSIFDSIVRKKELPKDIQDLFYADNIRHIYTSSFNNRDFTNSYIKIDSLKIDIYKYKIKNKINFDSIKINFQSSRRTNLIAYGVSSSRSISHSYRRIKNIDTLVLLTEKPFDTLLFNHKTLMFKGRLKTLSIILKKRFMNKTIFIEDRRFFSFFKKGLPYYLVFKKKGNFLYVIFIEPKSFNDEKIKEIIR